MFQYLCLAPSFTNVLNVYAFCNLHDVSWGTKGSDKAEALPSVSSKKSKDAETAVVEDTTRNKEDLDATFKETVTRALTKLETKEEIEKPTMDDENKTFRTRLVAFWMLSNAGLAVAIQSLNGLGTGNEQADEATLQQRQNIYFAVILYSTFGLALVKFIGVSRRCCRERFKLLTLTRPSVSLLLVQAKPVPLLQEELSCRCAGSVLVLDRRFAACSGSSSSQSIYLPNPVRHGHFRCARSFRSWSHSLIPRLTIMSDSCALSFYPIVLIPWTLERLGRLDLTVDNRSRCV